MTVTLSFRQANNEARWNALWNWLLSPSPAEDRKMPPADTTLNGPDDALCQGEGNGELQEQEG
jgi:hypothetical protein